MNLAAELYSKFRTQPEQLARALTLHSKDETLSVERIVSTVEVESAAAEVCALRSKLDGIANIHAAEIDVREKELSQLREFALRQSSEIASLRELVLTKNSELAKLRDVAAAHAADLGQWRIHSPADATPNV